MTEPQLSPDDLDDLLTVLRTSFGTQTAARGLLRRIGFPRDRIPDVDRDRRGAWLEIVELLEDGVVPDPFPRLVAAALRDLPAHPVLLRLAARPAAGQTASGQVAVGQVAPRHVLVLGASPDDRPRLRPDRELERIRAAAGPDVVVTGMPAAAAPDLARLVGPQGSGPSPDALHLACHGEGPDLVFESPDGRGRRVAARRIVDALDGYRRHGGLHLRLVVLNSCHSAGIAELFAPVADVVLAHRGLLDDECAAEFAGRFHAALRTAASVTAAAGIAAATTALGSEYCADLGDGVVVRPVGG